MESHISIERQQLIALALELLSEREFMELSQELEAGDDQDFATILETQYKNLNATVQKRWEDFEEAANEFALAEFLSLGALFESIGPITVGAGEISKLVKEYSYKMIMANYECYKTLFSQQPDAASDLYQKPMDCMKDCYSDYKTGITEIGAVMEKTRQQIVEPYESRQQFVDELKTSDKADKRSA
ncbi:MAG: hypothetical protein HRU20_28550, partial [Pseudomonadales bacterium]|nr:hypothetical protein [Pseudomonadales bacterium]